MADLYEFVRSLWVVWLMLIFLGIVAWAYWPSRRRRLQKHGSIPLDDDRRKAADNQGRG
jgi:cytochrome c oxidase cbb3-type subunit 4